MLAECKTLEADITCSDASRPTSFPECYDVIATGFDRLQKPLLPGTFTKFSALIALPALACATNINARDSLAALRPLRIEHAPKDARF